MVLPLVQGEGGSPNTHRSGGTLGDGVGGGPPGQVSRTRLVTDDSRLSLQSFLGPDTPGGVWTDPRDRTTRVRGDLGQRNLDGRQARLVGSGPPVTTLCPLSLHLRCGY